MPAFLEHDHGDKPVRYDCAGIVTVGRDKKSSIRLDDPGVSRQHALIREVGHNEFYLLDAGSHNGCYINDCRITTPTQLKDGDVLGLGTAVLTFRQEPSAEEIEASMSGSMQTMTIVQSHIRDIVVLVADIRGFTTLSEQIPIETLSKTMTRWFNDVQEAVTANQGRVDKFIGDCVMAVWNVRDDADRVVLQALRTGLAIQELTAALATETEGVPDDLRVGVGVHTGLAAMNIGLDSTAMGDTVNTAFRLETESKALGRDVVLSDSSFENLPADFSRDRHTVKLKGKAESLLAAALTFDELAALL